MRLVMIRDANLGFAIAAVLLMATLGSVGWTHSIATQRVREATLQANEESRLLDSLGQAELNSERARLRYLTAGAATDLTAFSEEASAIHRLVNRLRQTAAHDRTMGGRLAALATAADLRAASTERQVSRRLDGTAAAEPPLLAGSRPGSYDQEVLPGLDDIASIVSERRRSYSEQVTGRLWFARWLGAAITLLGIAGMLGLVHQLMRAWRRLRQTESESRLVASQLRASLDGLSQGVAVFSETGTLLTWNHRLGQLLDLPADLLQRGLSYSLLGQCLAGQGQDFLEPIAGVFSDAQRAGECSPVVYERTLRRVAPAARAHGTLEPIGQVQIQLELCRTLTAQGGFVLTVTDMTERVQGERLLRETQKMQALGQLTGGIAHDFNNMLTVILGSLEVTPDELSVPVVQQVRLLLSRMHRATQAAGSGAALTRQLLAFARERPLDAVPVDLGGLLPDLMPLLRHTIGESITVALDIGQRLWPCIVDVGQLQSAVLNLALNARDAMPDGGNLTLGAANIRFGAELPAPPELASGDYVRITVADTGQGMSREVIARAFEPFFTTKPEGHGTGLGLAMVFAFASQSGGRALISSEPGRGTTVSLYLPRSLQEAAAQRAVAVAVAMERVADPSDRAAPLPQARTGAPHILLVDDDASVREVAADTLRGLGYRVSEASDAAQALNLVAAGKKRLGQFELLLTDITLPGGMDGRALAARAEELSPATRVLFMSGSLDSHLDGPAAAGTQAFLSKPFRRRQLAEAVDRLIGA